MKFNSLLAILFLAQLAYAQKIKIGITDLEPKGSISVSVAEIMSEQLRYYFSKTEKIDLIEKEKIDAVLSELGFQQTGLTEEDRSVAVGNLANIEKLITGSISKFGDSYTVTARVIDLETGTIEIWEKEEGKVSPDEIAEILISPLVDKIILKLVGDKIASRLLGDEFRIRIERGYDIHKMDMMGESDPFVIVYVGNIEIGRTKFLRDARNPIWNEEFHISNYKEEPITLWVFDKDVTKEEIIGGIVILKPKNGVYRLKKEGTSYELGKIQISFK